MAVMLAAKPEAYRLLHEGSIALATIESNGIRIDLDYLNSSKKRITEQINELENTLKKDDLWSTWRRVQGAKSKLGSLEQLAHLLYNVLKLPCSIFTPQGKPSAKEKALSCVDLPFVKAYMKWRKLCDTRGKYLEGISREQVDGYFHPDFNLHLAATFRSSSGSDKSNEQAKSSRGINFQALPIRDPERGKIIRQCFIAREGHYFVEADLATIEVRIGCACHKDPVMMDYVKNSPPKDMHRDTASELFFLDTGYLVKHEKWAKKLVRDWAKNRMVFPQFYGSVWFQCAPNIWEAVVERNPELPERGIKLIDHLAKHGINGLGECKPGGDPTPGSFGEHVKSVENSLWNKRFTVYRDWKRSVWEQYLKDGAIQTLTGFVIQGWSGRKGMLVRNDASNHDIQGASFHCMLQTIILTHHWIKKHKMKTKILGTIHDSIIADVPENEIQDYLSFLHWVVTVKLPRMWSWINVPLGIEFDCSPLGGSWWGKQGWIDVGGGKWGTKAKVA